MAPAKKAAMSAFEEQRIRNMQTNQELLKDLSSAAQKIMPAPKPIAKARTSTTPRKRAAPVKREAALPKRTSSRLAGVEADSEAAKRKAEVEADFARETSKAKRLRVSGDIDVKDAVVEGKKWERGSEFLAGVMRGAVPYLRTFTEDDIKETTDQELKALRKRMGGLELYEGYSPNQIKITPERIYALGFHPTETKALIFAGDKLGNMGVFDASQESPEVKAEDNDDDEVEADTPEPAITAYKAHSRTITSFVFSADEQSVYTSSYDSSIRRLDIAAGKSVEVWSPKSQDEELPVSCFTIPWSDPNTILFSTLEGSLGRVDVRTPSDEEIFYLTDKKIGGFSVHPFNPHLVATASLDRTMKIWDLRSIKGSGESKIPSLVGEHESRLSVSHTSWSAAGQIATSSYDDTIKIYSFPDAGSWKVGHDLDEEQMQPTHTVKHNNQTGRWVTILKPQWQEKPNDGVQKFVIGNMNRFVDIYASNGEQLAQLEGDGITAVPAVTHFHPSKDWVAGGTASGKLCLWQ